MTLSLFAGKATLQPCYPSKGCQSQYAKRFMKKRVVVIDRKKWARGINYGSNRLLLTRENARYARRDNPENKSIRAGNMCCLGFACLAAGVSKELLRDQPYPERVSGGRILPGLTYEDEFGCIRNTDFSRDAAYLNDQSGMPDTQRQKRLRSLAAKHGFTFKFVN